LRARSDHHAYPEDPYPPWLLRVKVAAKVEDKAIAAELAAIQHLLEVRCVLGNNISGNAKTQLVVSSGAIRKLQRRQSDKVHLAPYANFLCTRFAACPITVEKDTRWFREQLPVTEEDLLVSGAGRSIGDPPRSGPIC